MKKIRGVLAILIACGFVLSAIVFVREAKSYPWPGGDDFDDLYDLKYFDSAGIYIKSGGNMGMYSSIAVRNVDGPPEDYVEVHISYYDATNGDLRYAYRDTSWHVEGEEKNLVDYVGDVGQYASIALDSSGVPHVSYYDASNGRLKYAKLSGTSWAEEVVDSGPQAGQYTSIAVDSSYRPHISYYDAYNKDLCYAYKDGEDWKPSEKRVDYVNDAGQYTSIDLTTTGQQPRISYFFETDGDLRYASSDDLGSSWNIDTTADTDGSVGKYTSLALDSSNNPHISYYDYDRANTKLKYAKKDASWSREEVDSNPGLINGAGKHTSIDLDTSNKPWISYYYWTGHMNWIDGELRYARWTGSTSATCEDNWECESVDTEGDVGYYTSIALDDNDDKHISYAGLTPSELAGHSPAVAVGCDASAGCVYVHQVWVQPEYLGGKMYNRIYYRRSSDNGETWDIPGKPISELRGETGYTNAYLATRPSIHVVGDIVHVAWIQEHVRYPDLPMFDLPFERVFYQRSKDMGDSWKSSDAKVDDSRMMSYVELEGHPPTYETIIVETSNIRGLGMVRDQSPVSVYATTESVYVAWQSGFHPRSRVYWDSVSDSVAETESEWGGAVGKYSSMVMDSFGRVFMSYYDETNTALKFAGSNDRGMFETQTIDTKNSPGKIVGQHTSIAIDDDSFPHIAYYDENDEDLKFAHWTGEKWETEIVDDPDSFPDDTTNVGQFTSIAVDSGGNVHVSYYDVTNGDLKYVKKTGGSWGTAQSVDTTGDVGQYTSLALDSSDNPHIGYYDVINGYLKYVCDSGSGFGSPQSVDETGDVGQYASLTLDSSDNPRISYYDTDNKDLKYARWTGTTSATCEDNWECETVDTGNGNDVGQYTSLALDSSGNSHISYYDVTNGDLMYAKWTGTTSETCENNWECEKVDTGNGNDVGQYTSLTLDPDGYPYICYYDVTNKRTKCREWAGNTHNPDDFIIHTVQNDEILSATWWDEDRDRWGNAGLPDITGKDTVLHVVYEDVKRAEGDLKYVYEGVSGWSSGYSIDQNDIVGEYTSIALDSSGRPHIAYYDVTNFNLKHTVRTSTIPETWQTETVPDPHDFVGKFASLVLVSNEPHIAYFDYTTKGIRYAYKSGSSWSYCDVPGGALPGYISLAVDNSAGAITQIAFERKNPISLRPELARARYTGPTCQFDTKTPTLPSGTWTNAYSSLAVDDNGLAYISYVTYGLKLRYVYETSYNTWVNEPVDYATRYTFTFNSIGLDSSGYPHIAYYDVQRKNLKYAYKDVNGWHRSPDLDTNGDVGQYLDMAMESDYPHISYYDATNGDLRYVKKTATGWIEPSAKDSSGDVGKHTSIALDSGKPLISYYDESSCPGIFYRKGFVNFDTDGVWKDETLVSDQYTARPSSPQVATVGEYVHVVWHDDRSASTTGSEIYYNRGTSNGDTWLDSDTQVSDGDSTYPYPNDKFPRIAVSGATVHIVWQKEIPGDFEKIFEIVDDEESPTFKVTHGSALAVGIGNEYRTSYYGIPTGSRAYAYYKEKGDRDRLHYDFDPYVGNWLDENHYCMYEEDCQFTSIGVDFLDLAHIAYYDGDNSDRDLYYMYQFWDGTPPNEYKVWANPVQVDGIDNNEDMGQYLSMALEFDQSDLSKVYYHISYYNAHLSGQRSKELMYAKGTGSSAPSVEIVDEGSGNNGAGKFTSIALDTENRAHISYYDVHSGDLMYASWTGQPSQTCRDNWECEPVDTLGNVGQYTSIEIDTLGKIHISYYDADNGNLKYAYGGSGSWSTTIVDSTDTVGKFTSLVLDVDDMPHISYYDDTNDDLRFAFKDSSGWHTFDPIDSEGDVGSWSSMSLGLIPYGLTTPSCPQISYVDATNEDLKHVLICPANAIGESDIMYDLHKVAGDSEEGEWGTDHKEDITWPEYETITGPDIAVWGNDRHMPYHIEWQEDPVTNKLERGAMGYSNYLDSLTDRGDLPDPPSTLMGASAVRTIYDGNPPKEQIYIIGGVIEESTPTYSDKVWRYDTTTDTYVDHCDLPRGLAYTSAVYEPTNGLIYVFGGKDENGEARDEIIKVHPTTEDECSVDLLQSLETARFGTSAVYLDNWATILIFGGLDTTGPNYLDEILLWQPGLGDVTKLEGFDLPQDMAFTSAIVYGTGIDQAAFVFGGQDASDYHEEIVKVHKPGGLWTSANLLYAVLPSKRSGTSATFDGTYGYIFGGKDGSGRFNDILRFNPRLDNEVAVVKLCYQLPARLQSTAAAYAEDDFKGSYIFGGGDPGPTDHVLRYRASNDYVL